MKVRIYRCSSGMDSLAEWSKALAPGASPQGRGFEPHSCHFCSEHFRAPVAQQLSEELWRLIQSTSDHLWLNSSQVSSGMARSGQEQPEDAKKGPEVTRSGQGAAKGARRVRKWPEVARSGQGVARGGQKQSQDKDTAHKGSG